MNIQTGMDDFPKAQQRYKNKFMLVQALFFLNAAFCQQTTVASANAAAATSMHSSSSNTVHPRRQNYADLSNLHPKDKPIRQPTKILEENAHDDTTSLEQYYDESRYANTHANDDDDDAEENNITNYSDILVVVAVDGTMAGISRSTGKTVWRSSSQETMHGFQDKQKAAAEASLYWRLLFRQGRRIRLEDIRGAFY
jgi:hypothetical protein